MNLNFWLAFLAYLLPTFPLGYFWHLSTFKKQYEALAIYRPDVIIPMGLLSMIIQGLIFSWAYPKLFSMAAVDWLSSSLSCFAIYGILAWSFSVLPVAAKFRMSSVRRFMALETAFTALQFAISAPLISWAWKG